MNKVYSLVLFILVIAGCLSAQPWYYDFGLGTGTFNAANSDSWAFLPAAQSGIVRVKIGDAGGRINLDNPGLQSLGSNSELRIEAPTTGSNNKFSLCNYAAAKVFYTKFELVIGDAIGGASANSGVFYFIQGKGDTYLNNAAFSSSELFTGIQWVLASDGSISTKYRSGSGWNILGSSPFSQGLVNSVEIYGNNQSINATYYRNGTAYVVGYNKQDIWINGLRISGLNKGGISSNTTIDSFMFYGEASANNVANCFIDNIVYANALPAQAPTQPIIELTASSLAGFAYLQGEGPSQPQAFSVRGENLTAAVSINASANYEVSQEAQAGWTTALSLSPALGILPWTCIYVRLKAGLQAGLYNNGIVTISSSGALNQTVSCSGAVGSVLSPNLLLEENFIYNPGTVLNSVGWAAHSGSGTNSPTVTNEGLGYPGYPSVWGNAAKTIGNGEDINKSFTAQNSGSVYCSFLLKVNNAALTGDYVFHLSTSPVANDFKAKFFVRRDANSSISFGLTKATNNDNNPLQIAWTDFLYSLENTYLVVLKYTFVSGAANDSVLAWINPSFKDYEPASMLCAVQSENDIGSAGLGAVCIRQSSDAIQVTIDGIRVAKTWYELFNQKVILPNTPITINTINIESNLLLYYDETVTEDDEMLTDLPDDELMNTKKVLQLYANGGAARIKLNVGAGIWRSLIKNQGTWQYGSPYPAYESGIITFFSVDFGVKGIAYLVLGEGGTTLPVELSSFTVFVDNQSLVQVTWITQSETDAMGFYVQRGATDSLADAIVLSPLISASNSSATSTYSYVDRELGESGDYYYWLQCINLEGDSRFYGSIKFTYLYPEDNAPSVEEVLGTQIKSIYPNPFSNGTNISYTLDKPGDICFRIYNCRGQLMRSYGERGKAKGTWQLSWDGRDESGRSVAAGLYFIKLKKGKETYVRKAVLLK